MDNQHRKITGFADLTQDEINVINEIKATEASVAEVHRTVSQLVNSRPVLEARHRDAARQVSIARTEFESAFFRLVRSIACPESPWIVAPGPSIAPVAPVVAPERPGSLRVGLLLEIRTVGLQSVSPVQIVDEATAREWASEEAVPKVPWAEVFDGERFATCTHEVLDTIKAKYLASLRHFDVIEGTPQQ